VILVCPTAFKGTLSAAEAAEAMARGARAVTDEPVVALPLSDGGNGLLDAVRAAGDGTVESVRVAGPAGSPVDARFLAQPGRAVVETAEACGLHLVPAGARDPLRATTQGVGELMVRAARGVERVVVGLGGSATVDAGAGMAAALGYRLLDDDGAPIGPGGAGLLRLLAIEPPSEPRLDPAVGLTVLADVTNPLLGRRGAARIFAPQKGASPDEVEVLEEALARWAEVVRRDLGRDVTELPGGGAAGGLGAAMAAYLDAPPAPGSDWVLDAVGFDGRLSAARVGLTGEGAWDAQSSMGKVTGEVVARSAAAGIPVLLLAGSVTGGLPRGVTGADGAGRVLDAGGIEDRVASALGALLAEGPRP
jgi:glycerate kinase